MRRAIDHVLARDDVMAELLAKAYGSTLLQEAEALRAGERLDFVGQELRGHSTQLRWAMARVRFLATPNNVRGLIFAIALVRDVAARTCDSFRSQDIDTRLRQIMVDLETDPLKTTDEGDAVPVSMREASFTCRALAAVAAQLFPPNTSSRN